MNVVKDLQSLIQLMHSYENIVVFPIGTEGQTALDWLRFSNLFDHICCIAASTVPAGFAQKFIYESPVIPFEHLLPLRETAPLVVVAPEQFHPQIDQELTRFGFKTVVFVRNDIHAQIRNELQKMYTTGQVIMWYMQRFDKKITEMEYRIAEQNEVSTVNTEAFAEYRNAFRGKDVVIAGNGPTLNYYKPMPNAIHICLNRAWIREDICFDYLFAIDALGSKAGEVTISSGFSKIKSKIFVGRYPNRVLTGFAEFPEFFPGSNIVRFYINECGVSRIQPIYRDICDHSLIDLGSVSFPALHFALFTYPKRIYLVGCDTAANGHFYAESKSLRERSDKGMKGSDGLKVGYARVKLFAKHHYPDTEIISINPVGLRGLFKDVYTDEYKASLAENSSMTPSFSGGGGYRIRDDPYSTFAEKFVA